MNNDNTILNAVKYQVGIFVLQVAEPLPDGFAIHKGLVVEHVPYFLIG